MIEIDELKNLVKFRKEAGSPVRLIPVSAVGKGFAIANPDRSMEKTGEFPNKLPHNHKAICFDLTKKNETDLISGELNKRSVERICLASNDNTLVSSNRSLLGKDENSNSPMNTSFRACFLKAFNLSDKSETLFHKGDGELIAISKDCKWVAKKPTSRIQYS